MANVFSVEIFFIVFRETLEASVIISVLLAFVKQGLGRQVEDKKLYRKLLWQIWIGAFLGLFICFAIGGAFIGVFYSLGKDIWAQSEDLWEGIFSIIATIMITIMGLAMLRLNKMKEKWRVKIAQAILDSDKNVKTRFKIRRWAKKYALALLPFVTTLREGVEAIVFVGGVSLGTPATAFPLAVICGLAAGIGVGLFIFYGGNQLHMQWFLIASTCFLYLICAGLWSRAIWYFQMYVFSNQAGGDVAENGSGPGSYNIKQSVWHVNCCNPETDGGWEIFNALFGWQNSATYGSVISYNVYWIFLISLIGLLLYSEKSGGLPFISRFQKKKMTKAEEAEIVAKAQEVAKVKYGGQQETELMTKTVSDSPQSSQNNASSENISTENNHTNNNSNAHNMV
ncbi:hypothetical protein TRICI_006679 [Trichomonascus ciferrii]|uniref:Plasma membrane iron permease n=1 Tax=Trichomonascus ciferrii TaxID=44093 RepID=A0A642UEU0_9ASCO|nr:hypothetical protein TRICI_006679 [Trichomonascus ciferrii]